MNHSITLGLALLALPLFGQQYQVEKTDGTSVKYPFEEVRSITFTGRSLKVTTTQGTAHTTPFAALKSLQILDPSVSIDRATDGNTAAIALSPNPATDFVRLTVPALIATDTSASYLLYTADGALVRQGTVADAETTIDLSDLPAGLYFVAVQTGSTTAGVQRLIKE